MKDTYKTPKRRFSSRPSDDELVLAAMLCEEEIHQSWSQTMDIDWQTGIPWRHVYDILGGLPLNMIFIIKKDNLERKSS